MRARQYSSAHPKEGHLAQQIFPAADVRVVDELTPLVALLHGRTELREIHPVADLIDQAVRGGA